MKYEKLMSGEIVILTYFYMLAMSIRWSYYQGLTLYSVFHTLFAFIFLGAYWYGPIEIRLKRKPSMIRFLIVAIYPIYFMICEILDSLHIGGVIGNLRFATIFLIFLYSYVGVGKTKGFNR